MSIIRIVEGEYKTEIDGSWTVYTDEFEAYAGQTSSFTAGEGTVFGEPELPPDDDVVCTCTVSKPAKTFKDLVALVKQAENMLISNGYNDMGQRINIIRGIYYGAEWSMDYLEGKSDMRKDGFNLFAFSRPDPSADPRIKLKCSENCKADLYNSLLHTPEVFDTPGKKVVDFGHLMIGLDSRRSWNSKNVKLPEAGGTGLECNTILGDLGGGAGMLAFRRVSNPQIRAKSLVFDSVHDYGSSVNLEGDIAAYVVGMDEGSPSKIVDATDQFKTIHEALSDYFDKKWSRRGFYFMSMLVGKMVGSDIRKEEQELTNTWISKIDDFGTWYIVTRMKDKPDALAKTMSNIKPAAEEIAPIFFDALVTLISNETNAIAGKLNPGPKAAEESNSEKMYKRAKDIYDKIKNSNPFK